MRKGDEKTNIKTGSRVDESKGRVLEHIKQWREGKKSTIKEEVDFWFRY